MGIIDLRVNLQAPSFGASDSVYTRRLAALFAERCALSAYTLVLFPFAFRVRILDHWPSHLLILDTGQEVPYLS